MDSSAQTRRNLADNPHFPNGDSPKGDGLIGSGTSSSPGEFALRKQACSLSMDDLSDLIDSISLGVLVVNQQHELIHSNAAGRQLVENGQFLQLAQNQTLSVTDPCHANAFKSFVDRCFARDRIATGLGETQAPTYAIELSDSRGAATCFLWSNQPTRRDANSRRLPNNNNYNVNNNKASPSTVSILAAIPQMLTADCTNDTATQDGQSLVGNTIFKDIYGLSTKENDLAIALVNGYTIDSFADSVCRSIHTIRNQLKSLFRKTNTHRQTDLVRQLTRINTLMNPVNQPSVPSTNVKASIVAVSEWI